jgi:hypothetical protein
MEIGRLFRPATKLSFVTDFNTTLLSIIHKAPSMTHASHACMRCSLRTCLMRWRTVASSAWPPSSALLLTGRQRAPGATAARSMPRTLTVGTSTCWGSSGTLCSTRGSWSKAGCWTGAMWWRHSTRCGCFLVRNPCSVSHAACTCS